MRPRPSTRWLVALALVAVSVGGGLAVRVPAVASPSGSPSDTLAVNVPFPVGSMLTSANGLYELVLQSDGNLVEYGGDRALWSTGTNGQAAGFLRAQSDGNLVLYSTAGTPLWASYAFAPDSTGLTIGSDGSLVVLRTGGAELWGVHPRPDLMTPGAAIRVGQSLYSADGQYQLILQSDGNLVLYIATGVPVWWTGTSGAMSQLVLQTDGNLVLYRASGPAAWNTQTAGSPATVLQVGVDATLVLSSAGRTVWTNPATPAVLWRGQKLLPAQALTSGTSTLVMQTDGNLVRYGPTGAVWWTNTFVVGSYAIMQLDGNFVVYSSAGKPLWWSQTEHTTATFVTISGAGLAYLGDRTRVPDWIEGPPNWAALARCESGGNPRAVNPAGYYGLYQFDLGTWASNGGTGNPIDASPAEQTAIASTLYLARGRAPWPVCGVNL